MTWSDPDRWLTVPVIGAMLGIFWRGIAQKKKEIDKSLYGYVDKPYCKMKQENMTLRLEATIRDEIGTLKDEIFEHMRAIEKAMQK